MFNMIIIDDEYYALKASKSAVSWEKIGINKVFTALNLNIRQAKEKFNNHPIQIMICDIEMPQGNGLELLEWVRFTM